MPSCKKTIRSFVSMMKARHEMRLRKESRPQDWPWSGDEILNVFKFTHVKREHDRTTKWMRENLTKPHADSDPSLLIYNCAVFRLFGTVCMSQCCGWQTTYNPRALINAALGCRAQHGAAFTDAYCAPNQSSEATAAQALRMYTKTCVKFLGHLWLLRNHLSAISRLGSARLFLHELRFIPGFDGMVFFRAGGNIRFAAYASTAEL